MLPKGQRDLHTSEVHSVLASNLGSSNYTLTTWLLLGKMPFLSIIWDNATAVIPDRNMEVFHIQYSTRTGCHAFLVNIVWINYIRIKYISYLFILINQDVIGAQFENHQASKQLKTVFALIGFFGLFKVNGDLVTVRYMLSSVHRLVFCVCFGWL